jgi:hypothetical protein
MLTKIGLAAIVLSGFTGLANAADLALTPPAESDWVFTVAPYGWAMGVRANASVGGSPTADFDVDFIDILEALDAPPVMIAGEARNGRFSIASDLIWAKLEDDVGSIVAGKGTLELTSLTGLGGYSLFYGDGGNLDVVAGARMWSVDIGLDFAAASFGRSNTWVDPVVGLKGRADISPDFYLTGWALIGGFGMSNDKLMWDVMGSAGYNFNDTFSMTVGYRGMGLDYRKNNFDLDATFSGPLIGAVFKF